MRRRWFNGNAFARALCTTAVAAATLLGAQPSAAAPMLAVSEGGGTTFPARSLVLTVPGRTSLGSGEVHLSENGQSVSGAVVTPIARAGAGDFGVVLAIDVSPSMKGAPIERAMAAARVLAAERTGKQEFGVVTFDQHATVALPLTDDSRAISGALARTPTLGAGAYIYNALAVAVRQLAEAKVAAGAVILLSDGASVGATPRPGHNLTASAIGEAAAAAHAQIYTVGLRDSSYTPRRMSLLARAGGGAFIESDSAQLAGVFTRIEAGLTSAYVVRYRSVTPLGRHVDVAVSVDGTPQSASLTYSTPSPAASHAGSRGKHKSFWVSNLALVIVAFGAALLVGLGLFALLASRVRGGGLRDRVGGFTATVIPEPDEVAPALAPDRAPLIERLLERMRWWPRFKEDVEVARIERNPVEMVGWTAAGTLGAAVLVGLLFSSPAPSLLVLVLGPVILWSYVRNRLQRQRDLFAEQLPIHLQEVASAMRAGHSLVGGITSMARSAPEPSHSEWARVLADEQLGRPLDEAMRPLGERMDSSDITQVALVAALHQRTGGNMAEVLERVADSVRERGELRRELKSLTAQARLSRYVVTGLPFAVAGAIALLNPTYIEPLFNTSTGVILLFVATGLVITASFVMRAITNIKV